MNRICTRNYRHNLALKRNSMAMKFGTEYAIKTGIRDCISKIIIMIFMLLTCINVMANSFLYQMG